MASFGIPVSFIATAHPNESRHFYENQLSLTCHSDDPYALVFDLGGTTLRIQKVESNPEVSHTVLGWNVENIKRCVAELTKKGVQFEIFSSLPQDELGIWSSPSGALIAWFKDPDGNTLSLTQL